MTNFFCIFIIKKNTFDLDLKAFIARSKDTESLLLTYNLLTTELKKALYKRLFFRGERSQLPRAAPPILKNSLSKGVSTAYCNKQELFFTINVSSFLT